MVFCPACKGFKNINTISKTGASGACLIFILRRSKMRFFCKIRKGLRNGFRPALALVLAFVTLIGVLLPLQVTANEDFQGTAEVLGEEVRPICPLPEYIHLDGVPIPIDDPRILNIVQRESADSEGGIAAFGDGVGVFSAFLPPWDFIVSLAEDVSWTASVSMTHGGRTRTVSSRRYIIAVEGIEYEIFCMDPTLPGPESTGAVYDMSGAANNQALLNVLRLGFPINPYWSDWSVNPSEYDRMWNAYVTRVAVAMTSNPTSTFSGSELVRGQAQMLMAGNVVGYYDADDSLPAIAINGERHREDLERDFPAGAATARSETFNVSYNRRTNMADNQFYFEWATGTLDGARLVVNNQTYVYPNVPSERFGGNVNFHIELPNELGFRGQEVTVYLVGIHNDWAEQVWLFQHPERPFEWQSMAFYIPYIRSSATFSFVSDFGGAELHIIKRNPQGQELAGAVFTITGPDGFNEQRITPASGIIELDDLSPGVYTITEITPPPGHQLATPVAQTVTLEEGSTDVVEVVFINPPIPGLGHLRIVKTNMQGQNRGGAVFNITGPSYPTGHTVTVPVSGWTSPPLQLGSYTITETTPPSGYMLSENPTQTVNVTEAQTFTSPVVATFANPPFAQITPTSVGITIQKVNALTRENIPGALIRIEGMSSQSISLPDGQLIAFDNTGINFAQVLSASAPVVTTGDISSIVSDGMWVLDGLPFGMYRVIEERAPNNFSLLPAHTAQVFWLAPPSVQVTFEEREPGEITVNVVAEAEGGEGEGSGYGGEGGGGGGGSGAGGSANVEIDISIPLDILQPPNIIVEFIHTPNAVNLVFENYPFGEIEARKFCSVTGQPLAGAHIRIQGYFAEGTTNGMPIDRTGITDSSGRIVFDNLPAGQYTLSEVFAPQGWVLDNDFASISVTWGQTASVNFFNEPMTHLEVLKIDGNSNAPLSGAIFELRDPTTGETWQGSTGGNGIVVLGNGTGGNRNELVAGRTYILSEIQAPSGYVLDTTEHSVVLSNTGRNTFTVRNFRNPTLTIFKRDGATGQPLAGAVFSVTYENGQTVSGSPFTTGADGRVRIPEILFVDNPERTLRVTEITPPQGYVLSEQNWQLVTVRQGEDNVVTFENLHNPTLTIFKRDLNTGQPLSGAIFEVAFENGQTVAGSPFTTGADGRIVIPQILFADDMERTLIVTEIVPPFGYNLANPNLQSVTMRAGEDNIITFENARMPSITVRKIDSVTGQPIQGAWFEIEYLGGTGLGSGGVGGNIGPTGLLTGNPFITNSLGEIIVPHRYSGVYKVTEIRAADNFWLDPHLANRTWAIEVRDDEDYLLVIENTLLPTLIITKFNALTHRPVPLTHFTVAYEVPNSPNVINMGRHITNQQGQIVLPFVDVGWYRIQEVFPAPGMALNTNNSYRTFLSPGQHTYELISQGVIQSASMFSVGLDGSGNPDNYSPVAVADNPSDSPPYIPVDLPPHDPVDSPLNNSDNPVDGSVDSAGGFGGGDGYGDIQPTSFDTMSDPEIIAMVSSNMTVTSGDSWLIGEGVFNWPLNSIVIKKSDATTGRMLAGAVFDLIHVSTGESGTRGTVIGTFTTNHSGIIVITGLEPGAYVVEEVIAPTNYMLSVNNRQNVFLQPDGFSVVEAHFSNFPFGSLLISLRCEITGQPLQNGEFRVTNSPGAVVGTSNGLFRTNQQGNILIPNLQPDSYIVTQLLASDGYTLGSVVVPQTIFVRPDGQTYHLEFTNRPLSNIIIHKIDGVTNQNLQGVFFEIRSLAGERIRNPITGDFNFTTNSAGMIHLPLLEAGAYVAIETRPLQGYQPAEPYVFMVGNDRDYIITIRNYRYPDYTIRKIDGHTDRALAGVQFEISRLFASGSLGERLRNPVDGSFIWTTDQAGLIRLANLEHGTYVATEVLPLQGYMTADPVTFVVGDNQPTTITIRNYKYSEWNILNLDGDSDRPLQGFVFEVAHFFGSGTTGDRIRNPLNGSFEFTTNQAGVARIGALQPGTYIITQKIVADGFRIVEPVIITVGASEVNTTVTIRNYRYSEWNILLLDGDTNAPLSGGTFEVAHFFGNGATGERIRNPLNGSFEFVTNQAGIVHVGTLQPGSYIITQTRVLDGYQLAEPVIITVGANEVNTTVTIRNYRHSEWSIQKLDGDTNLPLQGVVFEVAHFFGSGITGERIRNSLNGSFEFITNSTGLVRIGALSPGTYIITETRPLSGYQAAEPVIITVGANEVNTTVTIRNYRHSEWNVLLLDGDTNAPLSGGTFEVAHFFGSGTTGERLRNPLGSFEFTTNAAGMARIGALPQGTYIITQTRTLSGYQAAEPVIITVTGNEVDTTLTVRNYRYSSWNIQLLDGDSNHPISGAIFQVAHFFGNGTSGERLRNPANGGFDFITDSAGMARIGALSAGTYIITQTRALHGYQAAEPVVITVGENNSNTTVTIRNFRDANLTIRAINSVTREPLAGIVYEISRPDGTRVINPWTGFHHFTTDRNGIIFLPSIEDGRFYLREVRALEGFIANLDLIPFNINSDVRQRASQGMSWVQGVGWTRTDHVLVVESTPAAGLVVINTDAQTRLPLVGVEIEVRHADGRLVSGQLLGGNQPSTLSNSPQLAANGNFITDQNGRINLNHLPAGVYHIRQVGVLSGYQLDTAVHVVTVITGQQAVLEIQAAPLAGLRLLKVDSVTGEGIYNVEFMVFDQSNRVVGVFYTDHAGVIDFSAILNPGRYTIRLTRPVQGYSRDDVPRTVEFIAGRVTEIVWEATPIVGQLQILNVSGDVNHHNGLPVGTHLSGAIFEIFEARTGNLVDRIISNERGMAVSRPLPLGRYIARQVVAPDYYMLNNQEIMFDLEHENQIIRVTSTSFSANLGVTIRTTGPREVMQGHNVFYDVVEIRNDSTVPLADFFWRNILPTEAVRADKLITGTYNHALRYRVLVTTNKGNEIVVADNLSTLRNNVIELRPAHLGLAADEYITEIVLFFGQVPSGFMAVERPRVFVDVLSEMHTFLPNGMMFAYKADVGGRVVGSSEWVIGNSTTATTVFAPRRLPRSGW
jgi:uncharacterized surface anchored protein